MKALFVDDDVEYSSIFVKYLNEYCANLNLRIECDVCHDLKKIWDIAADYDLYFLDIEMGEINGLELAEKLRASFKEKEIIFISFYETYVFQSFRVKPFAFIRKNELKTDLYITLSFMQERLFEKHIQVDIPISKKNVLKVEPADLIYCQSEGHYVQFVFKSKENEVCRIKLNQVENILEDYGFIRVHVSYLINEDYIDTIRGTEIKLLSGQVISISRPYKIAVYSRIFDKKAGMYYDRNSIKPF